MPDDHKYIDLDEAEERERRALSDGDRKAPESAGPVATVGADLFGDEDDTLTLGGKASDAVLSIGIINSEFSVVMYGSSTVVIRQGDSGPINDRLRILTPTAFFQWFENRHTHYRAADGRMKTTSWGLRWFRSPERRQREGIEFHPDPKDAPGTPGYLNLWRGFAFEPKPKSLGYKTFKDHLLNNICAGDEKLFAWVFGFFAHMVQFPRERIGVALVLRGRMGTGKTVVGEHIGALFPYHYFLVDDPRYIVGQFNAHLAACLLIQADEAVWAGDKTAEGRLKSMITAGMQMIEAKGVDPIRLPNYMRVLMTSNEGWVVPAGRDERRFAVLDVDPRCAGNHAYFAEMAAELRDGGYEALLHDLLAFDLSKVDMRTIPKTGALLDQKERSLDSVPAWWLARLEAGSPRRASSEWEREVPRQSLFDDYLDAADRIGVKRRREETIFGREFRELVPGLRETRPFKNLDESNGASVPKRVRCYLLPPLAECRAAWDEYMGQKRDWPEADDDETAPDAGEGGAFGRGF